MVVFPRFFQALYFEINTNLEQVYVKLQGINLNACITVDVDLPQFG